MRKIFILLSLIISCCTAHDHSEQKILSPEKENKDEFVLDIIQKLQDYYVHKQNITENKDELKAGLIDIMNTSFTSKNEVAGKISQLLTKVIKDKHLRVWMTKENEPEDTSAASERLIFLHDVKYGFMDAQVKGDIGYLKIGGFEDPFENFELFKKYLIEAVTKIHNAKAVIIDLRKNGGGEPDMVAILSSFFLERGVALNDIYWRDPGGLKFKEMTNRIDSLYKSAKELLPFQLIRKDSDITIQKFSTIDSDYIGFKSNLKTVPVAILTSSFTFSAAEEFAYNMRQLKRATLIGEKTAGGANPGDTFPLKDSFTIFIPTGEAKNAVSHDNWETVGVVPHIAVEANKALEAAEAYLQRQLLK